MPAFRSTTIVIELDGACSASSREPRVDGESLHHIIQYVPYLELRTFSLVLALLLHDRSIRRGSIGWVDRRPFQTTQIHPTGGSDATLEPCALTKFKNHGSTTQSTKRKPRATPTTDPAATRPQSTTSHDHCQITNSITISNVNANANPDSHAQSTHPVRQHRRPGPQGRCPAQGRDEDRSVLPPPAPQGARAPSGLAQIRRRVFVHPYRNRHTSFQRARHEATAAVGHQRTRDTCRTRLPKRPVRGHAIPIGSRPCRALAVEHSPPSSKGGRGTRDAREGTVGRRQRRRCGEGWLVFHHPHHHHSGIRDTVLVGRMVGMFRRRSRRIVESGDPPPSGNSGAGAAHRSVSVVRPRRGAGGAVPRLRGNGCLAPRPNPPHARHHAIHDPSQDAYQAIGGHWRGVARVGTSPLLLPAARTNGTNRQSHPRERCARCCFVDTGGVRRPVIGRNRHSRAGRRPAAACRAWFDAQQSVATTVFLCTVADQAPPVWSERVREQSRPTGVRHTMRRDDDDDSCAES